MPSAEIGVVDERTVLADAGLPYQSHKRLIAARIDPSTILTGAHRWPLVHRGDTTRASGRIRDGADASPSPPG